MLRAMNLAGVLALVFCFAPAYAEPPEPASKLTDRQLLERLTTQVENLSTKLDVTVNGLAAARDANSRLERRLAELERMSVQESELQAVRDQIDRIRAELLDAIQRHQTHHEANKPATSNLISGTTVPPTPPLTAASPHTSLRTDYGTLHVANDFPIPQEILVNNSRYVVPALSSTDISVPVGTFTYYVVGDPVGVRTRTITRSRTHPIRIY